jgi:hypothetical protein
MQPSDHNATGTGALNGPGGAQPQERVSYPTPTSTTVVNDVELVYKIVSIPIAPVEKRVIGVIG